MCTTLLRNMASFSAFQTDLSPECEERLKNGQLEGKGEGRGD